MGFFCGPRSFLHINSIKNLIFVWFLSVETNHKLQSAVQSIKISLLRIAPSIYAYILGLDTKDLCSAFAILQFFYFKKLCCIHLYHFSIYRRFTNFTCFLVKQNQSCLRYWNLQNQRKTKSLPYYIWFFHLFGLLFLFKRWTFGTHFIFNYHYGCQYSWLGSVFNKRKNKCSYFSSGVYPWHNGYRIYQIRRTKSLLAHTRINFDSWNTFLF